MKTIDPVHGESQKEVSTVRKVLLVGVGPGDPEYVTARVAREIAAADIVRTIPRPRAWSTLRGLLLRRSELFSAGTHCACRKALWSS